MLERTAGRSRDVGAVGEMRSPCWSHQLEFGGRTTPLKDVMAGHGEDVYASVNQIQV